MTQTKEFFNEAFKDQKVPIAIQRLSERICRSFNITGICDPMYIANIIAFELALGDGKGKFNFREVKTS